MKIISEWLISVKIKSYIANYQYLNLNLLFKMNHPNLTLLQADLSCRHPSNANWFLATRELFAHPGLSISCGSLISFTPTQWMKSQGVRLKKEQNNRTLYVSHTIFTPVSMTHWASFPAMNGWMTGQMNGTVGVCSSFGWGNGYRGIVGLWAQEDPCD